MPQRIGLPLGAAALSALSLVAGGCLFDGGDVSGTSFRCDESEPCPSGFSCVAGRCSESGGDPNDASLGDGPVADACALPDAGGPPTIPLLDNFDDGETSDVWTVIEDGGSTATEQGGELFCVPESHPAQSRFAGYRSASTYDLEGRRVFVEVTAMVNTNTAAQARFLAEVDSSNRIFMIQKSGTLRFGKEVAGGGEEELGAAAYDPGAHRYWQIREEGGTIFGEVSSNGIDWNVLGSGDTPSFLGAIEVELSAGTETNVGEPGEAHYDNLNGGSGCP